MTEFDENGNVLMSQDSPPALASLYRGQMWMFCAAGLDKLRVGMKRSEFEKKRNMYLKKMVKKRKTPKSPLKLRVVAGAHDMKKEDIVDDVELVVSSTLSEEGWVTMSKRAKEMVSLCSIHIMDRRTLTEVPKLCAKEVLRRKMNFVLTDPWYSVRTGREDNYAEYEKLGSNGMEDVTMVLGDMIKCEANGHVFCSAQQFGLLYKAPASCLEEVGASTREYCVKAGSESMEIEMVAL